MLLKIFPVLFSLSLPAESKSQIVIHNDSLKTSISIGRDQIQSITVDTFQISIIVNTTTKNLLQKATIDGNTYVSIGGNSGLKLMSSYIQYKPEVPIIYYTPGQSHKLGYSADIEIEIWHLKTENGKEKLLDLVNELFRIVKPGR